MFPPCSHHKFAGPVAQGVLDSKQSPELSFGYYPLAPTVERAPKLPAPMVGMGRLRNLETHQSHLAAVATSI